MSKKFVSFILAFVLIFSLIPNMPTYGMGEQVEKNEKNQIVSDFTASTRADAEKEYEAEEWLKILAEQEKLITPEIRASMRESAIKTFEAYGLTNKDFAIKNAKPTDYGFKTQKELDLWLAEPYNPYKASAMRSGDDTPLSMNYSEYALTLDSMFCLRVNGYTQASELAWMIMGNNIHTRLRDWPGGNQEKFVDGLSVGTDAIVVTDPVKGNIGCVVDVISLDLSCGKNESIEVGKSLTISATTSHSNKQIAIRSTSSNISINGTTVTGLTEGSASIVVYLVDRPTVCKYFTLTITAPDPTVSFGPAQRMQYYGEPLTLYPTTTPAGLDITWSAYPSNHGYFVGNTFYATQTGNVQITATITGTDIKSWYIYYINPRNIILTETEKILPYNSNGFYLDVSINHGSILDIEYAISGSSVSKVVMINSKPYVKLSGIPGESTITMTAPGCHSSKTLKVKAEPSLYFMSPPAEIHSGSDYIITVFSNTREGVWQYFYNGTPDNPTSNLSSVFDEMESGGAGYYSFVLHAGNVGEHFGLAVIEDSTYKTITLEYTVLPPLPPTIERISSENRTVYYNESNPKDLYINLEARLIINDNPLDTNVGIVYEIADASLPTNNRYGITNDNKLWISSQRISDVQDNYGTRYGAHYTGEIVVKAYAEENANVYTTFTIDVECEPLEGVDNSNRCHYIAISHNDIGGNARPALFRDAMSLFSLSEGNSNGTAGGGSAQLQVCKTIRDAKVAAIHSHGKPNAISIVKNQHDEAYCLTANFIMNLHDGFFASTNLLISLACQSNAFVSPFASTGNVLSAFRNKGVKCTIGFDSPVATENARNFEESFYQYISENAADYPIIRDMFNNFDSDNSTYGARFIGDNYTTFNS